MTNPLLAKATEKRPRDGCYSNSKHYPLENVLTGVYTDKKENQFFLVYYIRTFRRDRLQSHI
jgi:hypothetical protein